MKFIHKGIYILALMIAGLSMSTTVEAARNQNDTFTVVIDAGHGGNDNGAVDNGAREKDINLAVAKKLAALIERKMKNTKVVMTRDDDSSVSLQERADIANRNKGDLFVSIHTNSLNKNVPTRKSAKGASVFVLGLHVDQNNLEVARRENSVIELESDYEQKYSGFDPNKDESYIIFEMSQKQNLGQSLRFAKDAQNELVRVAGRKDRGVKQAGFWVLWSTSMPAVLVELDFICNPESARFLTSEAGQNKLAQSLFNAIEDFGKQDLARKADLKKNKKGKSRKKNRKNDTEEASTGNDSQEQTDNVPVLVSATNKAPRVVSSSYDTNATRGNEVNYALYRKNNSTATGTRRRRSAAAKLQSDARVFDSGKIVVKYENDNLARTITPVVANSTEIAAVDNSNASASNKKQNKVNAKKKKNTADKNTKKNTANKVNSSSDKNTRIIVSSNQTTIKTSNKGKTKITVKSKTARRHTSLAGKRK